MLELNTNIPKGTKDWDKLINQNFKNISDTYVDSFKDNIIINGDFKIRKRGETFTKSGYSVDRFLITSDGDISLTGTSNGVKIKNTKVGTWHNFETRIEIPSILHGKKITFSFKLNTKGKVRQIYVNNKDTSKSIVTKIYTDEEITNDSITFECPNCNVIAFGLQLPEELNAELDMQYVKAEIGEKATDFIPRPYTYEELLCRRYYKRINLDGITFLSAGENIAINTYDNIYMRTKPTVSFDEDEQVYLHAVGEETPINIAKMDIAWGGYGGLEVHGTITGLKGNNVCTINKNSKPNAHVSYTIYLLLDSEIY